ncbi:MAG TPA: hypothetical protein VFU47_12025 [Armatimonadota bacterium]|nr:hypothetical protein [Armatimonadota bacterium]
MSGSNTLLMIIDPETREAYREGEGTPESGPLFFSSRERLERYAREEAIERYEVYEVPAGILARMKGKPYWLDGERK